MVDSMQQSSQSPASRPQLPPPVPPPPSAPSQILNHNHSSAAVHVAGLDKLDGASNYHTWKFTMQNALIIEGLWDAVNGSDSDRMRGQRALARICLSIKKELYQYVRNASTAAAAWKFLSDVFEDKGLFRRVLLLRKLHKIEFNDYSSMTDYIENVTTLVQQLFDIGRTIEDAEVAEILLSGLPSDYDALVSGLSTASATNNITSEVVKARLMQEYSRKSLSDINDVAYNTTKNTETLVCDFCKRSGHIKSRCFKLKRSKRRSSKISKSERLNLVSAFMAHSPSQDLYLDSSASNHMVNSKMFCNTMGPCNTAVTVANNSKIYCEGLGSMTLTLENQNEDFKSCASCLEGKVSAASCSAGLARRASEPLQQIHSDIFGPMTEPSWGGARYIVTFTDDHSRKTYGCLMKNKYETEGTRITAAF